MLDESPLLWLLLLLVQRGQLLQLGQSLLDLVVLLSLDDHGLQLDQLALELDHSLPGRVVAPLDEAVGDGRELATEDGRVQLGALLADQLLQVLAQGDDLVVAVQVLAGLLAVVDELAQVALQSSQLGQDLSESELLELLLLLLLLKVLDVLDERLDLALVPLGSTELASVDRVDHGALLLSQLHLQVSQLLAHWLDPLAEAETTEDGLVEGLLVLLLLLWLTAEDHSLSQRLLQLAQLLLQLLHLSVVLLVLRVEADGVLLLSTDGHQGDGWDSQLRVDLLALSLDQTLLDLLAQVVHLLVRLDDQLVLLAALLADPLGDQASQLLSQLALQGSGVLDTVDQLLLQESALELTETGLQRLVEAGQVLLLDRLDLSQLALALLDGLSHLVEEGDSLLDLRLDLLLQQLLELAHVVLGLLLDLHVLLLDLAQLDNVVHLLLELDDLLLLRGSQVLVDLLLSALDVLDVALVLLQLGLHGQLLDAAVGLLESDLLQEHLLDLTNSGLPVLSDLVELLGGAADQRLDWGGGWETGGVDSGWLLLSEWGRDDGGGPWLALLQSRVDSGGGGTSDASDAGDASGHGLAVEVLASDALLQAEDALLQLLHLALDQLPQSGASGLSGLAAPVERWLATEDNALLLKDAWLLLLLLETSE